MDTVDCRIIGMTIAISNMELMLKFYSNIFNIGFAKKEMYGSILYATNLNGLDILFCPAEIAKNTATQNHHQLDIVVSNLKVLIPLIRENGGELMGEIQEDEFSWHIGVYDPDHNSVILKQLKK